jgi:hypothetical protein
MGASGTLKSISLNARSFSVPDDCDVNIDLGGYENEIKRNGDGSDRQVKTMKPGGISGVQVIGGDDVLEYIHGIKQQNEFADVALELVGGRQYSGRVQISGQLQESSMNGVISFDLAGQVGILPS